MNQLLKYCEERRDYLDVDDFEHPYIKLHENIKFLL